MKKSFLKKIEKKLKEQRIEIISRSLHSDIGDVDLDGDDVDEIQGKMMLAVQASLNKRSAEIVKKIDDAVARIKDGSYGKCEDCEDDIAEKRLEFNPYYSTCISCAEEREIILERKRR
jgi:DnaK suppressor protein